MAARLLDIPERDLRDLIRITGLQPDGRLNMRTYSVQGSTSRVYPASKLILIADHIAGLRELLGTHPA